MTPAQMFNRTSFPDLYEQHLVGPLFRPFAEAILDQVNVSPGDRVLDIACGTGIVARLAKERIGRSGHVVGVDVNSQMLAVARRVAPAIDWREGNAAALPLDDGERFSVVFCHQGLQFFPDKRAAVLEMRRALLPGGRLAVATWRPVHEFPFLSELHRVAERHLGAIVDTRHGFGEESLVEALFREAGVRNVRLSRLTRRIRFTDGSQFLRLNTAALVGMSAVSRQMRDEERVRAIAAITDDSGAVLSAYTGESGLEFDLGATIASAAS